MHKKTYDLKGIGRRLKFKDMDVKCSCGEFGANVAAEARWQLAQAVVTGDRLGGFSPACHVNRRDANTDLQNPIARQYTNTPVGMILRAFTAEDYLLSFALPNFYFHAATAYDILRWKGLPIGKRDFIGRLRLKA